MKTDQNKIHKSNPTNPNHQAAKRAEMESPDAWWATLSPGQRVLAQVIAEMTEGVTDRKRIEIRREGAKIRARFVYVLDRPEKGCLSAIMLPEAASQGWN